MKQTLLTLTLALSSFVAMGQTKIDSAIAHDPKWQGIKPTYGLTIQSPTWKPLKFVFFNAPDEIMSISAPDSNKMITVKFNRKLVKFINDSTFVFKQP